VAMSTDDGRRQLTLSVNPWGGGDLDGPLGDLLIAAFCERSAARDASPPRIPVHDRKVW
jgi:hypothetical protein